MAQQAPCGLGREISRRTVRANTLSRVDAGCGPTGSSGDKKCGQHCPAPSTGASDTLPAPGRSVVCNAIGARSPARLLSKWRNHPPLGGITTTVSELTCSHTHVGMGATVATRGAHNVAACCRLPGGNRFARNGGREAMNARIAPLFTVGILALRRAGPAASAAGAIAEAATHCPDVMLMDVRLAQGSSGIEAARELHARQALRCIFLSANLDELTKRALLPYEPIDFVGKPVLPILLKRGLEKAKQALANP